MFASSEMPSGRRSREKDSSTATLYSKERDMRGSGDSLIRGVELEESSDFCDAEPEPPPDRCDPEPEASSDFRDAEPEPPPDRCDPEPEASSDFRDAEPEAPSDFRDAELEVASDFRDAELEVASDFCDAEPEPASDGCESSLRLRLAVGLRWSAAPAIKRGEA